VPTDPKNAMKLMPGTALDGGPTVVEQTLDLPAAQVPCDVTGNLTPVLICSEIT